MIYSGFLTGLALEFILPRDYDEPDRFPENRRIPPIFSRQNVIFAGICLATWTAYFRQK